MTEKDQSDSTLRRTFMKGAAATGVAATGVTALSGGAAAQENIRNLNVNLTEQGGLVNVNVQNVNVLNNLNVEDVAVTVIGGDAEILNNIDINIEGVNVAILEAVSVDVEDVLNDSVVQVAVLALNGSGDAVAAGSDALNV